MEKKLIEAVENIDEPLAIRQVKSLLASGKNPKEISNDLNFALQRVANRYEKGEYYIADLIMAADCSFYFSLYRSFFVYIPYMPKLL